MRDGWRGEVGKVRVACVGVRDGQLVELRVVNESGWETWVGGLVGAVLRAGRPSPHALSRAVGSRAPAIRKGAKVKVADGSVCVLKERQHEIKTPVQEGTHRHSGSDRRATEERWRQELSGYQVT
ncbi:hypothetical protein E2C01_098972 [Portunus trituberculatus]|uniref:Uncharacterized protein n=1 Tax=Portunus trituberculatus TaxID=210409 RepID=A0A5B7KE78_PORTR|nr:hypothetical protein [Portunus trituberculatus]